MPSLLAYWSVSTPNSSNRMRNQSAHGERKTLIASYLAPDIPKESFNHSITCHVAEAREGPRSPPAGTYTNWKIAFNDGSSVLALAAKLIRATSRQVSSSSCSFVSSFPPLSGCSSISQRERSGTRALSWKAALAKRCTADHCALPTLLALPGFWTDDYRLVEVQLASHFFSLIIIILIEPRGGLDFDCVSLRDSLKPSPCRVLIRLHDPRWGSGHVAHEHPRACSVFKKRNKVSP